MNNRNHKQYTLLLSLLMTLLSSCAPVDFEAIPFNEQLTSVGPQKLYDSEFPLAESTQSFEQLDLDENVTTLSFQVMDSNGNHVSTLNPQDLILTENGIDIPSFQLNSNSQKIVETVDIALVVDITGSMGPTIEAVKSRLIDFVRRSRQDGYRTRICLSTFGDLTVQKCDRFYDNNPDDPATLTQVQELVSEISRLRAISGVNDPGGTDFDENPMRAIIDVADAPWATQGNRFVILVTDNGFLYSPGNSGDVGPAAPEYRDVLRAIRRAQLKIFAATPSRRGYERSFWGEPGIVEASQGEWFEFDRLLSGSITLTTILNRILNRVQTSYVVRYTADLVPGLDPTRPINSRQIAVRVKPSVSLPPGVEVRVQQVQSSLPNGRQDYIREFKLSDRPIDPKSVVVWVNGEIKTDFTEVRNGKLVFSRPPQKRAKIRVRYQFSQLKDALQVQPINLGKIGNPVSVGTDSFEPTLKVLLNQIEATPEHYEWVESLDGSVTLLISAKALAEEDLFGIRKRNGLRVEVLYGDLKKASAH